MAANGWVLIRDRIKIGSDLMSDMAEVPSGAPIYLVAREIVHSRDFVWKANGHPVVVVCAAYDGNGGSIRTNASTPDLSIHGTNGLPGYSGKATTGQPGGHGANGTNGTSASPITLVALQARNVSLFASGGNAGHGGDGGKGATGSVEYWDDPHGHPREIISDGGVGGNGGNAGKAGNGASVIVKYVVGNFAGISTAAGAAGIGGKKGIGGLSGVPKHGTPRQAPSGKPGASTPAGTSGAFTRTNLPQAAWYAQAVAALPAQVLEDWANYRERVGEYLFRSYVAADLATKPNRALAAGEFDAVLQLRPNSPRAQRFSDYLKLGLTPIGLPYDHDLRPKVTMFEKLIVDYHGHRNWLFDRLATFLDNAGNVIQEKTILRNQADFHADMSLAAQTDVKTAQEDAAKAQKQLDYARTQVNALTEKLAKLDKARRNAPMSLGDYVTIIGEVVTAVAGVVAAVGTLGSSLAATVAAIGALATSAATLQEAGALVNDDLSDPKLTPEGKAMIGDLEDAIKKTKAFINAAEAVYDLINAIVENEPDAPEPQALAQQVQAAFDVAMARFEVDRSALATQGAQQKLAAYENAKTGLDAILASQSVHVTELTKAARLMLRQFQIYNDLFIRYHFYVNRAFDLYTLPVQPKTRATRFDFGYVHPDLETNAFAALERSTPDAASQITILLGKYMSSLEDVQPTTTRDAYIDYTSNALDSITTIWSITSPAVINALRTSGVATFQTSFSDVDDDVGPRTELKIQQIAVALLGAKGKNPNLHLFQVWITHSGQAKNRRHGDKKIISITAPSLHDLVNATLVGIDQTALDSADDDHPSEEPRSWGRSPITTWQIRITSQEAQKVDLSGLSELQFGVKYAFYDPTRSAKAPAAPQATIHLRQASTPEPV